MTKITKIESIEILDSRGIPTLETSVFSDNGKVGVAGVPSGSSAGKFEASELRDGGERYGGKGVSKAVDNVNNIIAPKLAGIDPKNQKEIDELMCNLDGTENKKNLGANAILSVSLACARLASEEAGVTLYEYLNKSFFPNIPVSLPTPFSVLIEAGEHSKSNLEVQEFMVVPEGLETFSEKIEAMTATFHELGKILTEKGYNANVGLEGAYGPELDSNEQAVELIAEAIKNTGNSGKMKIALDVASSEFFSEEAGTYVMKSASANLTAHQLFNIYEEWISKYPIISVEDGLAEEDWEGWGEMTQKLAGKAETIGDDLSVTNPKRVKRGIDEKSFTGCIIKPNQIGTLSETIEVINMLRSKGLLYIISHRGGETSDTFISDLAVASGAKYIKTGAPSRGERVAKYNRLLKVEKELGKK